MPTATTSNKPRSLHPIQFERNTLITLNFTMSSTTTQKTLNNFLFYAFALWAYYLYFVLAFRSGLFFKKDSEQDRLQFAIGSLT